MISRAKIARIKTVGHSKIVSNIKSARRSKSAWSMTGRSKNARPKRRAMTRHSQNRSPWPRLFLV